MKKFLLTVFYLMTICGLCMTAFQIFPILWPIQPMNFVVIAAGLLSITLNTIVELIGLYINEEV